jgi:thiamine pyrophosphate-dependent acetolactate synthase large subunit-like protein
MPEAASQNTLDANSRAIGTDLTNPDFAKIAEAAGLLGLTAATGTVRPMIAQALEHEGPAQELAMPPSISLEQATGSASSWPRPCSVAAATSSWISRRRTFR